MKYWNNREQLNYHLIHHTNKQLIFLHNNNEEITKQYGIHGLWIIKQQIKEILFNRRNND